MPRGGARFRQSPEVAPVREEVWRYTSLQFTQPMLWSRWETLNSSLDWSKRNFPYFPWKTVGFAVDIEYYVPQASILHPWQVTDFQARNMVWFYVWVQQVILSDSDCSSEGLALALTCWSTKSFLTRWLLSFSFSFVPSSFVFSSAASERNLLLPRHMPHTVVCFMLL